MLIKGIVLSPCKLSTFPYLYKSFQEQLFACILQLSKQLSHTAATCSSLQQQLGEAESHVEETTGQVEVLLSREKQLLQERRNLHQQLDKLRLEMARNAG